MSRKKKVKVEPLEPDRFVSQEKMRNKTDNTYEAVMASAREARRINLNMKMAGDDADRTVKVTTEAMLRLLNDEVNYEYKDLPPEDE